MPELSRFFGIIVRMYMEAGIQHHVSHFHAYYQDEAAVFSIQPKQQRFVEAWAEMHTEESLKDWELLQNGHLPKPIAPLQ